MQIKFKGCFNFLFIIRGGNRSGRSTGAYGLAYLKPTSAQLV